MKVSGLITLTTDFGTKDGNVGVMIGVIQGINPQARIVDISHEIEPQNILQAAFILQRACPYFPQGTVHLVVVDPGVGSERRAIILQTEEALFVAPDNGVLTYLLERAGRSRQIIHLTNSRYWLPQVSAVFHGRDIFAPVAAHLSLGVPPSAFGEEVEDPVLIPLPKVEREEGRLRGKVVHIDRFGNLLTNIYGPELIGLGGEVRVRVGGREIARLSSTYADGQPGEIIAYIDSGQELAVAVVDGSARERLGVQVGDEIEVVTS